MRTDLPSDEGGKAVTGAKGAEIEGTASEAGQVSEHGAKPAHER
jgi:hypothetical protein